MSGETNLGLLLRNMEPRLHAGDFVFCTVSETALKDIHDPVMLFKEQEGVTMILAKEKADHLQLAYSFIAAWITLTVHSSLQAVGLTAAFSTALAAHGISCNVVAAYHHDHIFVDKADAEKSMHVLMALSE
jgi:uncharacterized protein